MEVGQDVLIVESHYVVGWTGVFSCVCMGCVNLCCIHQLGWCVYSPRFSGGLVSNYVVDTQVWCVLSELHSATGLIGCRGEHSITLDLVSDAIALKLAFVG